MANAPDQITDKTTKEQPRDLVAAWLLYKDSIQLFPATGSNNLRWHHGGCLVGIPIHPFLNVGHNSHHRLQVPSVEAAVRTCRTGPALVLELAGIQVLKHRIEFLLAVVTKYLSAMVITAIRQDISENILILLSML